MNLVWSSEARKVLARLQPKIAAAIRSGMQQIAADPFGDHPLAARLQGTGSGYRLRRGDWRILYRIDRTAQTVIVDRIKPRGEAYKQ